MRRTRRCTQLLTVRRGQGCCAAFESTCASHIISATFCWKSFASLEKVGDKQQHSGITTPSPVRPTSKAPDSKQGALSDSSARWGYSPTRQSPMTGKKTDPAPFLQIAIVPVMSWAPIPWLDSSAVLANITLLPSPRQRTLTR